MVTLDVLAAAPLTIEMLVAHDISAYSRRPRRPEHAPRQRGYDGPTGIDPAITGEPPEEQAVRRSRRVPQ